MVPSSILVRGIVDERLIPPIFFFLTVTSGIDSLGLIPIFRSSSRITGRCWGLNTSRTTTIKSELRDTESISFPLPLPLEAPVIIPGRSKICILAPLYSMIPGMISKVVNSYSPIFDSALVSWFKMVDLPTEGNPTSTTVESPLFLIWKPLPLTPELLL